MTATTILDAIAQAVRDRDRDDTYRWVRDATDEHRLRHGCAAYPYADGTIIGAISATLAPSAVLELGTALGYTACWWATAAGRVDTVDRDPVHVELARDNVARAAATASVTVHLGDFSPVLADLRPGYDAAFFDGYAPSMRILQAMDSLLAPAGVLVMTNLDLGSDDFRAVTKPTQL